MASASTSGTATASSTATASFTSSTTSTRVARPHGVGRHPVLGESAVGKQGYLLKLSSGRATHTLTGAATASS
jgi:hypothetical protein